MKAPTQDLDHIHHWMIATQDGPASDAVCRTCGDKREFDNAFTRATKWRGRAEPSAISPVATPPTDEQDA